MFLHKGFSVILALLVLCSTISITVEKHFCGETLIDVAIFSDVEGCAKDLAFADSETQLMKSCCKKEVEIFKGQNDLEPRTSKDFTLDNKVFIASFAYTYLNLFEGLPKQIIPHKNYLPPNLIVDIQLLDSVFLI